MLRTLVVCVLLVLVAAPRLAVADIKIAYVDLQAVVLGVEDGKLANARLKKWLDEKQVELDREQTALRSEKDALDKTASTMAPAARAEKLQQLQQRAVALAQKAERQRSEFGEMERKEMAPILAKINATVARLAEKQDLDFVLEKKDSGVVFARPKHDLTSAVVREYSATR